MHCICSFSLSLLLNPVTSFIFCIWFFLKLFCCCSSAVVCIYPQPQPSPTPPPSSLPSFVHVSFIVVPENTSPHYHLPPPLWLLSALILFEATLFVAWIAAITSSLLSLHSPPSHQMLSPQPDGYLWECDWDTPATILVAGMCRPCSAIVKNNSTLRRKTPCSIWSCCWCQTHITRVNVPAEPYLFSLLQEGRESNCHLEKNISWGINTFPPPFL